MFRRLRTYIINQFGFSPTEANGFILLLIILVLAIPGVHIIIPSLSRSVSFDPSHDKISLQKWHDEIYASLQPEDAGPKVSKPELKAKKFIFDPNKASFDEMRSLGFPEDIANRVINYRSAGGEFVVKSDLQKIYGIDEALVTELSPWMSIPEEIMVDEDPISEDVILKSELNTADQTELMKIRGIGPVLSSRIIKYRNLIGGFYDFYQLPEVYGLHDSIVVYVKDHFILDPNLLVKLNINSADAATLSKHPYIDRNVARVITNYRTNHGKFRSMDELRNIKIITDSLAMRIAPYLNFDNGMP